MKQNKSKTKVYRKFNGESFHLIGIWKSERSAKDYANRIRLKYGSKARIVKCKDGWAVYER